jgi:hypothetical protein
MHGHHHVDFCMHCIHCWGCLPVIKLSLNTCTSYKHAYICTHTHTPYAYMAYVDDVYHITDCRMQMKYWYYLHFFSISVSKPLLSITTATLRLASLAEGVTMWTGIALLHHLLAASCLQHDCVVTENQLYWSFHQKRKYNDTSKALCICVFWFL